MNRANARWWLAITLTALALTIGYAAGTLTTPTVERVTWIDYCPRGAR